MVDRGPQKFPNQSQTLLAKQISGNKFFSLDKTRPDRELGHSVVLNCGGIVHKTHAKNIFPM